MSLLLIITTTACIILAWKLATSRRVTSLLVRAARSSEPIILPQKGLLGRHRGLDDLADAINDIVAEKANITGAGQAYHDQIQVLLGNLREAVVMVDEENRIRSANPSLLELVDNQEIAKEVRLDSLFQGTTFIQFLQEVQLHGSGHTPGIKVRINNASRWLEISAARLNEKASRDNRYTLFIFHDITRQKQLEKMRTEFVANVSHELRTPVTVIKGFAETLMEDDHVLSAGEKKRFLEKICRNSERLHRLLEDLLLLTRLESAEMVLQLERFSLNDFLHDYVDNLAAANRSGAPVLQLALSGDVEIEADPLRLSQVLHNLINNARIHAKGATTVILGTTVSVDCVKIHVSDNGCGIPEKDLPHIFQRFFRVEKGRSRESGGTGLGLSIVKHIVAQHGGAIHAESKAGEGTRIECSFPLQRKSPLSGLKLSRQ